MGAKDTANDPWRYWGALARTCKHAGNQGGFPRVTGEGSMYGYLMYETAKQRMAEQQRAAQRVREARAAARGRRARKEAPEAVATPVIPDFADEMFEAARDAVPAPRTNSLPSDGHSAGSSGEARRVESSSEVARGRHARTSR